MNHWIWTEKSKITTRKLSARSICILLQNLVFPNVYSRLKEHRESDNCAESSDKEEINSHAQIIAQECIHPRANDSMQIQAS